jgi:cation diffusion facilitator family transporter
MMTATPLTTSTTRIASEKRAVALSSVLAAMLMTMLKLITGLMTGSLGILSDAAHSGLDLVGAALTLLSVRLSDKPADEDHPYGHGKFENLSAFAETFLMAASCVWIVWEAIDRIVVHPVTVRTSIWPFLVLVLSIAVDYWRSRRLLVVARRYNSAALEADAMHFASDIWSSVAVIAGLAFTWLGDSLHIPWMRFADPVAAIIVSLIILRFAWKLAWQTIGILLDAVPYGARYKMLAEVAAVPGVLSVDQARLRRSGASYFADLSLALSRNLTFQSTEQLVQRATDAVHRVLPGADVVIHTVPREDATESIFDRIRAVAARNNVAIHDLSIQSVRGKLRVEQHVEVNETMTLRRAHDFICNLESQIRHDVPEIHSVLTHIESEPATIEEPDAFSSENRALEMRLRQTAAAFPEIVDIHEVVVSRTGEHIQVSCHCTLGDELPMYRVHEIMTSLEARFKIESPEIYRVLIHPEPVTDNTR